MSEGSGGGGSVENDRSSSQERLGILDGRGRVCVAAADRDTAAAGRKNSYSANMNDIFNHEDFTDGDVRAPRRQDTHASVTEVVGERMGVLEKVARDGGENGVEDARSSAASVLGRGTASEQGDEAKPPDEAYMHSLGYGNLSTVLPILLDRRAALEVSNQCDC